MTNTHSGQGDEPRDDRRATQLAAIVDEIQAQAQLGKEVDLQELLNRHSGDAVLVREVLESLRLLGLTSKPSQEDLPHPKEMGDYEILEEIGRGGMGVVYRARQKSLDRIVALKMLPLAASLDRKCLERFRIETHSASILQHPNILAIYGTGCEHGVHYYAMQFIPGESLQQLLRKGIKYDLRKAVDLIRIVAEALQHAHELGVVHRDIKPSNLMIDDVGKIWITDFGLAQVDDQATLTLSGDFVGTLRYMSPEQAMGGRTPIDHRTDIYSLGATLFELLTGRPMIDGEGRVEILHRVLDQTPLSPRVIRQLPKDLQTILMKATARERDSRYASAAALAEDLQRFLEHRPILASRPGLATKIIKFAARHPAASLGLAMAPLLFFVGLLSYNMVISAQKREIEKALQVAKENETQARLETRKAKAVSDVLQQMVASANPDKSKGEEYTVRQLLDDLSGNLFRDLEDQPDVAVMLHSTIGNAYRRLGSPERALEHLKTVVEYHLKHGSDATEMARSFTDLGWSYAALGEYRRAVEYAQKSVAMIPKTKEGRDAVQAMWCLQHCLLYDQRFEESDAAATQAIRIAKSMSPHPPEYANIIHDLAQSHTRQGKTEEGLRLAQEAIALHRQLHGSEHPELGWGYEALGRAQLAAGSFAEAVSSFEKALEIFEISYPPAHKSTKMTNEQLELALRKGGEQEKLQQHQQARLRKLWSPIFDLSQTGDRSLLQHLVVHKQSFAACQLVISFPEMFESWSEACAALEVLCKAKQDMASQLKDDSLDRFTTRIAKTAETLKECAVKKCEQSATAWNSVAWRLSIPRDPLFRSPDEALQFAQNANAEAPNNGAIWNTLGLAYLRVQEHEKAIAALRRSQTFETSDEYDNVLLAIAFAEQGSLEEANKNLEETRRRYREKKDRDEELESLLAEAEQAFQAAQKQLSPE